MDIVLSLVTIAIFSVIYLIVYQIRKLEHYPFLYIIEDISGKRNVDNSDFVDKCLCKASIREQVIAQPIIADRWKARMLKKHPTQKKRINSIFDEHNENDIVFRAVRLQTRYKQISYVRHAYVRHTYKVDNVVLEVWVPRRICMSRIEKLKEFDFELTIKEASSKEQRKLMTAELKYKIKLRDNYTCQICGKHMPDEVGLHIDHIIPVAKGGLSIEKNLRVLCSKCNGKKGSKTD